MGGVFELVFPPHSDQHQPEMSTFYHRSVPSAGRQEREQRKAIDPGNSARAFVACVRKEAKPKRTEICLKYEMP
jgi:hypothetical protein